MDLVAQLRLVISELFGGFITNDFLLRFIVTTIMIIFWVLLAFIVTKVTRMIILKSRLFEQKLGKTKQKNN